jgi:general secretion pathway protein F
MGAFEFVALDQGGKERKGVLEGDTPRQVRSQLRERGWVPLSVDEVRTRAAARAQRGGTGSRRGMSATDLALFTRQMATLVRSGLPVEEALSTVARQTDKPRVKGMVMGVRSRVMEGHALAAALEDFPQAFPELYRATVAAGEQSGFLAAVLERLADYTETRQQVGQKTMLSLLYPAIITVVAILVVSALLVYVVPQVVEVFQTTGQQLPDLTLALIATSDFLRAWGLYLLLALAVALIVLRLALRQPAARHGFHALLLRLPVLGRMIRGGNAARFARTLSIMAASGVPVLDSLRIAAQVLSNLPMRAAVETAAERVREGASLHQSLDASGYFPPMTIQLIASGEAGGNLEEMLERAANSQEREMDAYLAMLMGLFEPILILAMGGVVLIIVLAILLPIFELNQLVQ